MATDLGALLNEYASGDTSGLLSFLEQMGLPLTQDTITFLGNEMDLEVATGNTGLFNGWHLPAGTSANDFFEVDTSAAAFAAASGWRFFPTPQQLAQAARMGLGRATQQQQWAYFASLNPKGTAQMPWLDAGMTKQSYQDYTTKLGDIWQQYTGAATLDEAWATINKAAQQNWSTQKFQQFVQTNPGTLAKYGWIKHGMTYNDFQQYKLNNKTQVAARFGAQAGDTQFIKNLDDPLTQFNAQSSAVQAIPQAPSGPATAGASSFGRAAEAH